MHQIEDKLTIKVLYHDMFNDNIILEHVEER